MLQRVEPLAQHSFDGRFPARVDPQLLPQLRSVAEAVALEPLAQRCVILRVGLDLAQRRELRLRGGVLALGDADRFGRQRARFLKRFAFGL